MQCLIIEGGDYLKKSIYIINIIAGVLTYAVTSVLQGGAGALSGAELQVGYALISAFILASFLMVVGGIGGLLNKTWGKKVVLAGAIIGAIAWVIGGSQIPPIILAVVAIATYTKG